MALQCEHGQKNFPTNTSLYRHKHSVHKNSALVLVNHNHKKMDDGAPRKPLRRPRPDDDSGIPTNNPKRPRFRGSHGPSDNGRKKSFVDPQYDDGLVVVDKYVDPGEKPLDSDGKIIPPTYDPQRDDDLKIIDEYKPDNEDDDQLTVIDSYSDDGQSDDNLSVVDIYDDKDKSRIKPDYKKKYFDCLKAHKSQRAKFLKRIARINNHNKSTLDRMEKQIRSKCQDEIDKL